MASPQKLGSRVIIRTVTHYLTGRITGYDELQIVLEDAAWVADAGRWTEALTTGKLEEVEPFPDPVMVNRGSIVDMTIWRHELPRETLPKE